MKIFLDSIKKKLFYISCLLSGVIFSGGFLQFLLYNEPFYGNNFTNKSIGLLWVSIGFILGIYIGTIFLKKITPNTKLFTCFVFSVFWIELLPLISKFIFKNQVESSSDISVLFTSIFWLLPFGFFGGNIFILLFQIFEKTFNNNNEGRIAGNIFSSFTLGSLISIILGLSFISSNHFIHFYFMVGVIASIILVYFGLNRIWFISFPVIVLLLVLIYFIQLSPAESTNKPIIPKTSFRTNKGLYHVIEQVQSQTNALLLNGIAQSVLQVPNKRSFFLYVPRIAYYISFLPPKSRILIAGLRGGLLAGEIYSHDYMVDVCEEDKILFSIAKEHFFMSDSISEIHTDIRHYLKTTKRKYDAIILDLTEGENQLSHYYSVEGFFDVRTCLNKNGFFLIHFENNLVGDGSIAIQSVLKTMQLAGFYTRLIDTYPRFDFTSELLCWGTLDSFSFNNKSFRLDSFATLLNLPAKQYSFLNGYEFTDGIILTDNQPQMELFYIKSMEEKRKISFHFWRQMLFQKEDLY